MSELSPNLSAAIEVVTCGVEDTSNEATTMSARSYILLERFCSVLDLYLAAHPEKLCITDESLKLPNATTRIVVGPDTGEEGSNAEYCDHILFLVQYLLQLGQDAYRWQESGTMQVGVRLTGEFKALLPTALDKPIRISSGHDIRTSHLNRLADKLGPAARIVDANFYVSRGDRVIATIESNPECDARAVGIITRDRTDPFRLSEVGSAKMDGWDTKLLLQLASQCAVTGLKMGLLVADWGRILLPYEVIREPTGPDPGTEAPTLSRARIVFSSTPCYDDVLGGPHALLNAKRTISERLQDLSSRLQLRSLPNAVFYLLAWVLQAVEEANVKTEIAEREGKATRGSAPDGPSDREAGPSSKRGPPDGDREEGSATKSRGSRASGSSRAGQKDPGSSTGESNKGKGKGKGRAVVKTQSEGENKSSEIRRDYNDLIRRCRLVTTYLSSYTPVNSGTFATVHSCLVQTAELRDGDGDRHQSDHLGGQPNPKISRPPSSDEVEALLKIQRVPLVRHGLWTRIDPRVESPYDDPPTKEEDMIDIQHRTMRELRVYLQCQDLQGLVIPQLYGVVAPRNFPFSSAHKLMIQSLEGEPIAHLHRKFFSLWRKEIIDSAIHAISSLHSRSVWHGDLSNSNVRVEWRQFDSLVEQPSIYKFIHASKVLAAIEQAQRSMGISDKEFDAAADKLSTAADAEDSAIVLTSTSSPLENLKMTIRPHIWLIDFAESKVVNVEEEHGLLAAEVRNMKVILGSVEYASL
ncbi:hypothetical protein BCV69DRAFT_87800 [Microstroma glucosiphilum]|uniref:Uncharacterized protein n=1 Tax=Pseudomicrostroma glucosiphilum TaxID=1684307 RepID=A0A316TY57_9BASI|nr:hypothetical protein BCV69DRAFT_87800 [Pseudomicrostroma glucosiphilum]PWN18182.1 hypothetical protein BCV69DRAFT_87800 [Pseudomicrostroma glucosiphilum]